LSPALGSAPLVVRFGAVLFASLFFIAVLH
jgi:hypothetical protein